MLPVSEHASKRRREMEAYFNTLGKDAFTKSHWDLAAQSSYSVDDWRAFLTDPVVAKYIREEMDALSEAETRKMVVGISDRARSTGTAQTLLALDKSRGITSKKTGPVFVYMAVPLNDREQYAPNVQQLDTDPFRVAKE